MVFLRNYTFDFLHEGHNGQPYVQRKKNRFKFQSAVFYASKSGQSQEAKVFLTIFDIQSHISLELQT